MRGFKKGQKHSEETKKKMSNAKLGVKRSKEAKAKLKLNRVGMTGKKHSKKSKEKMSVSSLNRKDRQEMNKRFADWRRNAIFPKKDTKIEVKIQNFLKKLGIEFYTHQHIKINHGYQCDILIPSINLVIECDGDYWHKYPIGREIDHIRTSELLNNGFKVLRLWGCEIIPMNIKQFQERLNEI